MKRSAIAVNVCAGVYWIWTALARFDRLSLPDGDHFPAYRGAVLLRISGIVFRCVLGLLFLVVASRQLKYASRHGAPPEITTLFGPHPD